MAASGTPYSPFAVDAGVTLTSYPGAFVGTAIADAWRCVGYQVTLIPTSSVVNAGGVLTAAVISQLMTAIPSVQGYEGPTTLEQVQSYDIQKDLPATQPVRFCWLPNQTETRILPKTQYELTFGAGNRVSFSGIYFTIENGTSVQQSFRWIRRAKYEYVPDGTFRKFFPRATAKASPETLTKVNIAASSMKFPHMVGTCEDQKYTHKSLSLYSRSRGVSRALQDVMAEDMGYAEESKYGDDADWRDSGAYMDPYFDFVAAGRRR